MDAVDLPYFLADWSKGRGALYQRLAWSIREAIRRGDVGARARLPSERALARSLGISRTTVVGAYRLLRDEGLLESTRGSGTRIAASPKGIGPSAPAVALSFLKLVPQSSADVIDCSVSVIPTLDELPDEVLGMTAGDARELIASYTYDYLGLPPLRAAIAERYARLGLPTAPDEVLVTTGAQQAIQLLFSLFGRDGGTILVENPTYVGALDAARASGARIVGLPTDAEGAQVRPLRETLDRSTVRLVYLMTGCHNPTGAVMSDERRREIARVTEAADTALVDDMTLADLVFDARLRAPPLESKSSMVISIGSMSKVFWAGLRVGWIRAPASLIGRLVRLKMVADLGSSHVSQLLAARLVPMIEEVSAIRRHQLAERRDLFAGMLREQLPSWSWLPPSGGPFLWVRLPHGDAETFCHLALRHGVQVLPGRRMSPDDSFGDYLRISYVAEPARLPLAVERLAHAWEVFESSDGAARMVPEVVV